MSNDSSIAVKHNGGSPGIVGAYPVPHPPLIVPSVGKGEERKVRSTIDAYEDVARRIQGLKPDLIVVTSPHAPLYADGFFVDDQPILHGDMSAFHAPQTEVSFKGAPGFASELMSEADAAGIATTSRSLASLRAFARASDNDIDHGTFVPLYFLKEAGADAPVLRIGLSGLSAEDHRELGRAIARVAKRMGKRIAFVASGDLSHKLKEDGPYGYDPAGPVFDEAVGRIFDDGDLEALFKLDEEVCEDAAECGLRSFQIMAGALQEDGYEAGNGWTGELLSLEGPFGVGYGVAAFERAEEGEGPSGQDEGDSPSAHTGSSSEPEDSQADPYVSLARKSVEHFVRTHTPLPIPHGLSAEMYEDRAGVFVSLHENGSLRGCIGTIGPVQANIVEEIIQNGISACSHDPRFLPVTEDELDYLSYSVDVLMEPEPIEDASSLDPKRYGVIVTKGARRGLLLPNLEGVDTVDEQLSIAKQKAGLSPMDQAVSLERFEVIRHDIGGEPRKKL